MRFGLNFCLNNRGSFAFTVGKEPDQFEVNLTLAQLITLNWLAAQEKMANLLPPNTDNADGIADRKKALLPILYDIATAYGHNRASCAGGACIRLGTTLAAQHQLVHVYEKGVPLTGELAYLVSIRLLSTALQQAYEGNPAHYWQYLTYLYNLSLTPEEEIRTRKRYEAFLNSHRDPWLAQLVDDEGVDTQEAQAILAALKDSYPITGHRLSYELVKLMPFMNTTLNDKINTQAITLDSALAEAKYAFAQQLMEQPGFSAWVQTNYGLSLSTTDDNINLVVDFVSIWLSHARYEKQSLSLSDLMTMFTHKPRNQTSIMAHPQSLELASDHEQAPTQAFTNDMWRLTLWQQQQAHFKKVYPNQANWLASLTDANVLTLLNSLTPAEQAGLIDTQDTTLIPLLITSALSIGLTANLCLNNLTISHQDLRAHDFTNLKLTNVTFNKCILPLAGANLDCEQVKFVDCCLANIINDAMGDTNAQEFFNYLCANESAPSLLVTQFLLQAFPNSILSPYQDFTPLYLAAERGYTTTVQAILASPFCLPSTVTYKNRYKEDALRRAIWKNHSDCVEALLANPHTRLTRQHIVLAFSLSNTISKSLLDDKRSAAIFQNELQRTKSHFPTFLMSAAHGYSATKVSIILDSPFCTQAFLEKKDNFGRDAIWYAKTRHNDKTLKAILASRHCTKIYVRSIAATLSPQSKKCNEIIKTYLATSPPSIELICDKIKEHPNLIGVLKRLAKGAKSHRPYWRKASLKLDNLLDALAKLDVEEIGPALTNPRSALARALDSRRLPGFFSTIRELKTTSRQLLATEKPKPN